MELYCLDPGKKLLFVWVGAWSLRNYDIVWLNFYDIQKKLLITFTAVLENDIQ